MLGQRHVGEAGVPPGARPLGLAVAQQDELAPRVIRGGAIGQLIGGIHMATVLTPV